MFTMGFVGFVLLLPERCTYFSTADCIFFVRIQVRIYQADNWPSALQMIPDFSHQPACTEWEKAEMSYSCPFQTPVWAFTSCQDENMPSRYIHTSVNFRSQRTPRESVLDKETTLLILVTHKCIYSLRKERLLPFQLQKNPSAMEPQERREMWSSVKVVPKR